MGRRSSTPLKRPKGSRVHTFIPSHKVILIQHYLVNLLLRSISTGQLISQPSKTSALRLGLTESKNYTACAAYTSRLSTPSSLGDLKIPHLGVGFALEMLSALIPTECGYPAVPLTRQLAHQGFVQPGPLVLWPTPLKYQIACTG